MADKIEVLADELIEMYTKLRRTVQPTYTSTSRYDAVWYKLAEPGFDDEQPAEPWQKTLGEIYKGAKDVM